MTDNQDSTALGSVIEKALATGELGRLRSAIYKAGEAKQHTLAPMILKALERSDDERVLENAAWAIGKLGYGSAVLALVRLLEHSDFNVVRACSWALGEIGSETAAPALRRTYQRWDHDGLRQVIGGALKKIAGISVRAYAGKVAKRLKPPPSARADVSQLVARLEELDFRNHRSEVVQLRERLQQLDPEYFAQYIRYRAQRPAVLKTLDSDQVYYD